MLSDAVADRIWRSSEDEPSENDKELACMRALFRKWTSDTKEFPEYYLCGGHRADE
jgi:hypothetical protein